VMSKGLVKTQQANSSSLPLVVVALDMPSGSVQSWVTISLMVSMSMEKGFFLNVMVEFHSSKECHPLLNVCCSYQVSSLLPRVPNRLIIGPVHPSLRVGSIHWGRVTLQT
jgi:hypothetical protein